MGISFKENVSDLRNSKSIELYSMFKDISLNVDVFDPYVQDHEVDIKNFTNNFNDLNENYYDSIIITIPHDDIIALGLKKIRKIGSKDCLIFDIKSGFPKEKNLIRL